MSNASIKVLTYNIHKGFSTSNLRFVLHDIKDSLRHVDADVVFLQEIQGERTISKNRFDDWPNNRQFEFLADQVWQHHAYGKNAIYKSGHHGNAILSKYPFIKWENIDVSIMRSASRSLLHGTIQIPGIEQKVHIICVHLGLFERERESQLATLSKRISSHVPSDEPLIIAGDFNDWRNTLAEQSLANHGFQQVTSPPSDYRSFPSWLPVGGLDKVFVRGGVTTERVKVVRTSLARVASDHLPIVVDFSLK